MDPQVYAPNCFMEFFGINLFLEILSTIIRYFGIL